MTRLTKLIVALLVAFAIIVGYVEFTRATELDLGPMPDPMATVGFKETAPWTGLNKGMLAFAVGGSVADIMSTEDALGRGCVEANPLLGENPSTGTLVLLKVGGLTVGYLITEYIVSPETRQVARNWIYGALGVVGTGAAIHNYTIDCD